MIRPVKLKLLLQCTDSFRFIKEDLGGAISRVKKDEYNRAIDHAHNITILRIIEHRVKTDARLTEDDRDRLLSDLGTAIDYLARFGPPPILRVSRF